MGEKTEPKEDISGEMVDVASITILYHKSPMQHSVQIRVKGLDALYLAPDTTRKIQRTKLGVEGNRMNVQGGEVLHLVQIKAPNLASLS